MRWLRQAGRLRTLGGRIVGSLCPRCCIAVRPYYAAVLCSAGGCGGGSVPGVVYVPVGSKCPDGAPVGDGAVIRFDLGACYRVTTETRYVDCPPDPPEGYVCLPDGAVIGGAIVACEPDCERPECQRPQGYWGVRRCGCAPEFDVSNWWVRCELAPPCWTQAFYDVPSDGPCVCVQADPGRFSETLPIGGVDVFDVFGPVSECGAFSGDSLCTTSDASIDSCCLCCYCADRASGVRDGCDFFRGGRVTCGGGAACRRSQRECCCNAANATYTANFRTEFWCGTETCGSLVNGPRGYAYDETLGTAGPGPGFVTRTHYEWDADAGRYESTRTTRVDRTGDSRCRDAQSPFSLVVEPTPGDYRGFFARECFSVRFNWDSISPTAGGVRWAGTELVTFSAGSCDRCFGRASGAAVDPGGVSGFGPGGVL